MDAALTIGPLLLEWALPQARDIVLGDDLQRALDRVVDRAIDSMLGEYNLDPDLEAHLHTVFRSFIAGSGLSFLFASYREGRQIDPMELRTFFDTQGHDSTTLPMDFGRAVVTLASELARELETEASSSDSPLFNLVSLSKLGLLERWLRSTLSPIVPLADLQRACSEITRGVVAQLTGLHPTTARVEADTQIDSFLSSDRRWCVVIGQSGVGKSILMAQQATRLINTGWVVLLLRGRTFKLDEAARNVASRFPQGLHPVHWHRLLLTPWAGGLPSGIQGFAILVDGLDERDRGEVLAELVRLADGLQGLPVGRVKVILSCGEITWMELRWELPFGSRPLGSSTTGNAEVIRVTDFDDTELEHAIEAIGVADLLASGQRDGRSDPHVEAVRELLRHPATFGIYAALRQGGDLHNVEEWTWSTLVELFVERALQMASQRCHVHVASLRESLVKLSGLAREYKNPDFRLEAEVVMSVLPDFGLDDVDLSRSAYAALVSRGILDELEGTSARRFVGFRLREVGSYFLSFALQRAAERSPLEELGDLVTQWLEEVYDYPPVIDAIVAWAYRLSQEPSDPKLAALVEALVENPSLRLEVVFRLMPPAVAESILRALGRADSEDLAPYHSAILAIRPSPAALAAFRHGLFSRDERVARLAIRAAGTNQDSEAIPALITLLDHADEDIRLLASNALGWIGAPAVPHLLAIIGDRQMSGVRRVRSLLALRAAGYRSQEVAAVLEECLATDATNDPSLQRNAFLVAAALRVNGLTSYAISALRSEDAMVVLDAAKLLTEVPDAHADQSLLQALQEWTNRDAGLADRYSILRQVGMALMRMPTAEKTEAVLSLLRTSFKTGAPLSPIESIWLVEALPMPEAWVLVLEDLAHGLAARPPAPHIWQNLRAIAEVWQPKDLAAPEAACKRLTLDGLYLSRLVVDALIEAPVWEGNHLLNEGNARRWAVTALIKCRAPELSVELARLLPHAEWPRDQQVCDALWALSDTRAEDALLTKLAEPVPEEQGIRRRRDAPLYALATCGAIRAGEWMVGFLKSVGFREIQLGFDEQVLRPLVLRGVLQPDRLAEILADEFASEDGRVASLLALAGWDAPRFMTLFHKVLHQDVGTPLRAYAASALGLCGDDSVAPDLLQLLRSTDEPFLAEHAARALAQLEHDPAVRHIEEALQEFAETSNAGGVAAALSVFKDSESIPFVLDALDRSRFPFVRHKIVEALGEFWPNQRVQQAILEQLAAGSGGWEDRGEQVPAIHTLARRAPNLLLAHAAELHSVGHLDPSARQALTHWMPQLARTEGIDGNALQTLLEQLVCDHDFWVREQAAQAMVLLPLEVCQRVYIELYRRKEPWSTACAVRTLGYWQAGELDIERELLAPDRLVREAASEARKMRARRENLRVLIDQLGSQDASIRASALYALEDQGDEATIWLVGEQYSDDSLVELFIDSIVGAINRRRRDEHRKRVYEEDRRLEDLGIVWFD